MKKCKHEFVPLQFKASEREFSYYRDIEILEGYTQHVRETKLFVPCVCKFCLEMQFSHGVLDFKAISVKKLTIWQKVKKYLGYFP